MSTRTQRVEALLQREIADVLFRGNGLRDPRLQNTATISITGVSVSPDLGNARIFVDVLSQDVKIAGVVQALNAASGWIRGQISQHIRLRRIPMLRFETDASISHGAAIERVLNEIRREEAVDASPPSGTEPEGDDEP